MSMYDVLIETLRKKYDVWPWLELSPAVLASGSQPGAKAPFQVNEPYAVYWDKMPFIAWDQYTPGDTGPGQTDLSVGAGTYNWWIGAQQSLMQEAQTQIAVEDLLGSYNDKWLALAKGGTLEKNEDWQANFFLNSSYNGGAGLKGSAQLFTGLRGYRVWEKGGITPPQRSRNEYLKSGKYILRSYNYVAPVTVLFVPGTSTVPPFGTGPGGVFELTMGAPQQLDCPFLCHRIRIRPQALPTKFSGSAGFEAGIYAFVPSVFVSVTPMSRVNAQIIGGFASRAPQAILGGTAGLTMAPWQMTMGVDFNPQALSLIEGWQPPLLPQPRLDTQWTLSHPITFESNERINCQAQATMLPSTFVNTYSMTMEFVFDGELIIPK